MRILYSYDADTKVAKVFDRNRFPNVVCEVNGVDVYVGNLLQRLAEQMYEQGREAGCAAAIRSMREHLSSLAGDA